MSEMRFLKFYYGKCNVTSNRYLPDGLDSLSDKLRYLEWHRYCLKSLPSKFSAKLLVELSMPYSNLQKLWDGVQKLKMIDLHNCDNLVGFGKNENYIEIGSLSTLVLSGCKKLNASNLCFNFEGQSTLTSLVLENCCNLEALPDSIGLLSSLQCLRLSGSNVERLSPNIKNLNSLKELRLDNCKKLMFVSVSELPPSLRLFSAINCISLVSDLTTLDLPFEHRTKPQPYPQSVFFPGAHVPKRFSFCSEENHHGSASTVTIRHLPETGLYGLVLCVVLSESIDKYGYIQCFVYQNSKRIVEKLPRCVINIWLWIMCFFGILTSGTVLKTFLYIEKYKKVEHGIILTTYPLNFHLKMRRENGQQRG
ncbi:hypothetical protein TSUD_133500 [Trifolium subterraneum]|uniref:Uncharacterized protein n=1 Tax=Trifolium subterraneum TaxID=3900 RepID=A0A2Z6PNZ1_TRISU|nr:hypothetical protein TSUD_133500 [Trifolium subterraneum]